MSSVDQVQVALAKAEEAAASIIEGVKRLRESFPADFAAYEAREAVIDQYRAGVYRFTDGVTRLAGDLRKAAKKVVADMGDGRAADVAFELETIAGSLEGVVASVPVSVFGSGPFPIPEESAKNKRRREADEADAVRQDAKVKQSEKVAVVKEAPVSEKVVEVKQPVVGKHKK